MNKKTSEELSLGVIDGTELVRVAKGSQNYKTTLADIAAYAGGGGAAGLATVLGISAYTGANDILLSDNGGGVYTRSISDGFGAGSLIRFVNSGLDISLYAQNDILLFGSDNVYMHANNQVLINSSADVVVTTVTGFKLAATTASRALATDASNNIVSTSVTATELGYLSGVTGAIQTQINAKGSGTMSSLNGLSGATQTFTNDTNVTIVSGGTAHVITWAGTLADGRIASAGTWNAKQTAYTILSTLGLLANASGVLTNNGAGVLSWGAGGSGANTALSNLASVSINTSLLAQTGVDLGSTANQFRDLYLFGSGTYGSTYLKLTGTPTSTRTWTIQDATDTFVGLATTDTLTNKKLSSSTTTIVDATDATKVIGFSLSGMTTAKTLTLSSAQTTTQTLNFPNITGSDTLATLGLAQNFTGANTHSGLNAMLVSSSGLTVRNPANTFKYTITAAAIAADRTLNLPLITATDTLASLNLSQVFNGTIGVGTQLNFFSATTQQIRNTNGGSNINPMLFANTGLVTVAGVVTICVDATNQLAFAAGNGTRAITRARVSIINLTNTANSEAGDLAFYTQIGGAAAALRLTLSATNFTLIDAYDCILGSTTGTKWGTATSQKQSFWNATPIVQPTTAIAAATFVANTSLIANDTATFDGYTLGQIVKALRNIGLLA